MDIQVNSFSGGINKDIDPSLIPENTLRDALNIRILDFEGSSFVVSNIEGTEERSALTDGFIPIGWKVYDEVCYIFSFNETTGEGEIGTFPSINWDSVDIQKDLEPVYRPLKNYRLSSLSPLIDFKTSLFNFDKFYPLSVELRIDFDNSVNIYFSDNKNPIRLINAGFYKDELTKRYVVSEREYVADNFNNTITLIPSTNTVANFEFVGQELDGELPSGGYIYHLQYSNDKINLTDIAASSFVAQVYELRDGGIQQGSENPKFGNSPFGNTNVTNDDANTSISNVFNITGLDTSYRYIHITVEYISGENQPTRIVYKLVNPYEFSFSTFSFKHRGNEERLNIGDAELNQIFASFRLAKDITQADSRLLAANIKARETEIVLKFFKNFASRIVVNHIKKDLGLFADLKVDGVADVNRWLHHTFDYQGAVNDYRNPKVLYDDLGYWYGEIYSFAAQFIYKDGSLSPCFPIQGRDEFDSLSPTNDKGIYRFRSREQTGNIANTTSSNQHSDRLVPIFPVFTIPSLDETMLSPESLEANEFIEKNISGIRIMRQERRKDALFQALVVPTYSVPANGWTPTNRTIFINFRNQYRRPSTGVSYSTGNYWINARFGDAEDAAFVKALYYADKINYRKVLPFPFGYIEGDYDATGTDTGRPREMIGGILAPAYADPIRWGLYSLDQVVSPAIRSIVNNNNSVLELMSIARTGLSDFYDTPDIVRENFPPDPISTKLGALMSPTLCYLRFDSECITRFNALAATDRFIAGSSFFVEYNIEARNEKFSSAIETLGVDNAEVLQDTYILFQKVAWNSYIGFRLGTGVDNGRANGALPKKVGGFLDIIEEVGSANLFTIGNLIASTIPYWYRPSNRNDTVPPIYNTSTRHLYAGQYYDVFVIAKAGASPDIVSQPNTSIKTVSGVYGKAGGYSLNTRVFDEPLNSDVIAGQYLLVDNTPGFNRESITVGSKTVVNDFYQMIVNYYTDSGGRHTGDISDFYQGRELLPYMPITKNISVEDFKTDIHIERGVNGDNYLGVHYQQVWQSTWRGVDFDPQLKDTYANGGMLQQIVTDNNFNPYSRTRSLNVIGESQLMANGSLGNRRTFFPLTGDTRRTITGNNNILTLEGSSLLLQGQNPVNEALFVAAKQIHNQQSEEDNRGGSIQNSAYIVNNLGVPDVLFVQGYFPTRVWYSEKHITNSFVDAYRAFRPLSFQDFDIKYGIIIAIRSISNQVIIVQERAVSYISYNERTAVNQEGTVFIDSNTILSPFQQPISQQYGSQHKLSVLATDNTLYGVDVANYAIWRINGGALEILSEDTIKSLLVAIFDNWRQIIVGESMIHTSYDKRYREVLFTFYLEESEAENKKSFTLCYSEKFNKFSSFYSFIPFSGFSIYERFFTIDMLSKIQEHSDVENRTVIYGNQEKAYIKYICNKSYEVQKIFDNIVMISNFILPEKVTYKIEDENGNFIEDEIDYSNGIPTNVVNDFVGRMKHREGTTRFSVISTRKENNGVAGRRYRGKYIEIGIHYRTSDKISLNAIQTIFRISRR